MNEVEGSERREGRREREKREGEGRERREREKGERGGRESREREEGERAGRERREREKGGREGRERREREKGERSERGHLHEGNVKGEQRQGLSVSGPVLDADAVVAGVSHYFADVGGCLDAEEFTRSYLTGGG